MVVTGLFFSGAYAQESDPGESDYNQWSIDGGIGLHRPYNSFSQGYYSATPDLFAGELGVRYMINEYFGMKLGLMYDRYTEDDASLGTFSSNQYGFSIRGVANLGRVLKFEEWTETFNLLAHYGLGISFLNYENVTGNDWVGNGIGGLTLQAKVAPRVTLYGDITAMENFSQHNTFDGGQVNRGDLPVIYKGSIGVSISLGRNERHADYYVRDIAIYDTPEYDTLDSRLTKVESEVKEIDSGFDQLTDRVDELSGRVDDLDKEVRSIASTQVIDANALLEQLIEDGYFNIYFNFDRAQIDKVAANTIKILKTYLENNPGVNVDLFGYADERGAPEYNRELSQRRADAVAEALVNVGIDATRLNPVGRGEDLDVVHTASPESYQLARRVTFSIR